MMLEVAMEAVISNLLQRFEKGALSRRELVQGLAMLAVAGGASPAAAQGTALKAVKVDHVSIQVTDLPRAIAFYQKVFGMTLVSEDKPNEISRMGTNGKVIVSLHHKNPTGIVDHFAIGVEGFNRDAVTESLNAMGLRPENNLDAGFHVKDPEGMSVQIVGA
jgi:catechol 2,3-dioxygenase-like lactoylglutathione lyase family enzyme